MDERRLFDGTTEHNTKPLTPDDRKLLLQELQGVYDAINYPQEFTDRYVIMECLAERNGIDTFLVQKLGEPIDQNTCTNPNESAEQDTPTDPIALVEQDTPTGPDASVEQDTPIDPDAPEGPDVPACFVAKCYDKNVWTIESPEDILRQLDHDGLPKQLESFENEDMIVTIREYVAGVSLDLFALDNELTEKDVSRICVQLCDILGYLHHRPDPIIHRDIKPQNVIVRPDGELSLIDFDIARTWQPGSETDTRFFGTVAYAPPEQYGFTQTDVRSDIYSLGILLRYLLTGNTRENRMVRVYKPLQKIIDKCTAFAPEQRYADVDQVKKALLQATPAAQKKRAALITLCSVAAAAVLFFAGYGIYEKVTYDPFNDEAIPAYVSDEDRITDAVEYIRGKFDTDLFDDYNKIANYGWLRQVLIECYGLDHDYVYRYNGDMPQESDAFFLPWSYPEEQLIGRDEMVYVAVKLYDPEIVADWSSLKDDNGEYPGTRVALAFADKTGLTTGVNKPDDLDKGEVALILANTDRVFTAAEEELQETE